MVDAEWLLKSHREHLSVEKALQRRIKQLQMDDNENDVIESMELGTIQEAGMPRAQSRFGSKTERAASDFREKAAEERTQAQEQKQFLEERLKKVRENLKLYDVVRIDHFRGFDEYYAIPYGDETAENGRKMAH